MEKPTRDCTVLIVDIAGTVGLRTRIGEEAAGHRIKQLLNDIISMSQQLGGTFLKSYGDDVLATFEGPGYAARVAAEAAIEAMRLAEAAGLQLYAGLYCGPVEFGETMGHPVAMGQTVNLAARLHKLTEDAPGRIFVSAEFVKLLPAEMQREASRFGLRRLKGFGEVDVWTIAWRDRPITVTMMPASAFRPAAASTQGLRGLVLRYQDKRVVLQPDGANGVLGRLADCTLQVPDPEPRISGKHLIIEFTNGLWMGHDISRNGSWIRDDRTGEDFALMPGGKVQFPVRGAVCLGRPLSEDAAGQYTVRFEAAPPL